MEDRLKDITTSVTKLIDAIEALTPLLDDVVSSFSKVDTSTLSQEEWEVLEYLNDRLELAKKQFMEYQGRE